jgi:hypothetical protein
MSENNIEGVGAPTPLDRIDGPDHRAAPVNELTPTKAFWRTLLQVGPLALITLVGILPEVIQVTVDGFGQQLPENFRLGMLAFAGALTALSATTARVMAIPSVQEWLRTYAPFFSVAKK